MTWDGTIDFETNDLTQCSGSSGTGLSATTAAKHAGTYGMSCAIADATDRYIYVTAATPVPFCFHEFYLNPNNFGTSATNKACLIGRIVAHDTPTMAELGTVVLIKEGSVYYVDVRLTHYNGIRNSGLGASNRVALATGHNKIGILYRGTVRPDGFHQREMSLSVAGVFGAVISSSYPVTGWDSILVAKEFRLGAMAAGGGYSGTLYYDDINYSWTGVTDGASPRLYHAVVEDKIYHVE